MFLTSGFPHSKPALVCLGFMGQHCTLLRITPEQVFSLVSNICSSLYVYVYLYINVCVCVCLCVCVSVCVCVLEGVLSDPIIISYFPVCLCLSVCVFVDMCVCLSVCLSV